MPTVVVVEGFRIIVRTSDHRPPHVHVVKGSGEIRVLLYEDRRAVYWDEKRPMAVKAKVRAVQLVQEYQAECLDVWRRIHG